MLKKWTKNEIEQLKSLKVEGMPLGEIALVLNRPYASIASMSSRLVKQGEIASRKPRANDQEREFLNKKENLLELIKIYVSSESAPGQVRTSVIRAFGSWTEGLEAAGISGNIGGKFCKDKLTRVYLLRFEGFYKVGVTQQQVKSRLSGAPEYQILDVLETDLDSAIYLEKELKKSINSCQYITEHPWFERNGKTECFIPPRPINSLEEIFDL